jgi:hypothetical protein
MKKFKLAEDERSILEAFEAGQLESNLTPERRLWCGCTKPDTHKFVRKLQEAGFDQKQAEGLTEAMHAAIEESELVTKKDLQIGLAPVKADLNLLKWMMGALIAIANFSKQFL